MYYYEIEYTIDNLTKDLKKQNEGQEEQKAEMSPGSYMSQAQKSMKSQQSGMSKSINTPRMPKVSTPSIPRAGNLKF
jgi:hypothetical protein